MYGLPQTTIVKKQLPKKSIFVKFDLKSSQRDDFDADIARIDIVAVMNPTTVPAVGEGAEVKEFYVLDVQLKRRDFDAKNIALLTRLIPRNIVFALHYEDKVQFAIYHTKLITSNWRNCDEAVISLSGLNLDVVWENIVKNIGSIEVEDGNTLTEQIKENEEKEKIKKEIKVLQKQLDKEKQFNKQIEINALIKALKKKLK